MDKLDSWIVRYFGYLDILDSLDILDILDSLDKFAWRESYLI